MLYKIIENPDKKFATTIKQAVINNDGYCPCKFIKDETTRCMCEEFREQESGECHCGLYVKIPKEF